MNARRVALALCAAAAACAAALPAGAQETVRMKDGEVYKGLITGATEGAVLLLLPDQKLQLSLDKDRILSIDFPSGTTAQAATPAPTLQPPPAEARREPSGTLFGNSRFFATLEWFDPGDAYNTFLLNLPLQDVSLSQFSDQGLSVTSGFGGRIGMMYPVRIRAPIEITNASLGVSLGYVHGPSADINVDLASLNVGVGLGHVRATSKFRRVMMEFQKDIPLSSKGATLRLGASGGLASGEVNTSFDTSGAFAGSKPGTTVVSWTGFSWELSPAIMFYRGGTEWWAGLRYSVFPKLTGGTSQVAFEWETTGFYLGFGF